MRFRRTTQYLLVVGGALQNHATLPTRLLQLLLLLLLGLLLLLRLLRQLLPLCCSWVNVIHRWVRALSVSYSDLAQRARCMSCVRPGPLAIEILRDG